MCSFDGTYQKAYTYDVFRLTDPRLQPFKVRSVHRLRSPVVLLPNGLAGTWHHQFMEVELRIYALVNQVIVGTDNGLSHLRSNFQAIIWTTSWLLSI